MRFGCMLIICAKTAEHIYFLHYYVVRKEGAYHKNLDRMANSSGDSVRFSGRNIKLRAVADGSF